MKTSTIFHLKVASAGKFALRLLLTIAFTAAVSIQSYGQTRLATQRSDQEQPSNADGRDPRPEDATHAILAAFNKYEVVAMDAAHGNRDLDDFILHLVRDPAFPTKVNDIVVECGNSLYQPILDRYIAGEDVPLPQARQAWRNTTQLMCSVSGFYETLFPLVRRINQKLSPEWRLRVLAADPPIDWSKVSDKSDTILDRDGSIASVMEKEVLSKHRRALMLFGTFHLFHSNSSSPVKLETAVERYEKHYPGVTLVIADQIVFYNPADLAKFNGRELEARMASWPVPSVVQNLKGTWLADMNKTYFSEMADAYLYLGPSDLLLAEPRPAEILFDKEYMAELQRRAEIIGVEPLKDLVNPNTLSDNNFSPFLGNP
ncbi:MAG: hypothetical protein WCD49_14905 [Candidatus Acidiferrales bacterium]